MPHNPWFKVWQDRILSDPNFQVLRPKEVGVLFRLWLLTARENGEKIRRTRRDFTLTLHGLWSELSPTLNRLKNLGWINWTVEGTKPDSIIEVSIKGWENSQAPSPSAERMRRYRKRLRSDVMHTPPDKEEEEETETDKEPPIVPHNKNGFDQYFLQFWNAWPKGHKVGKGLARRSLKKIRPGKELMAKILAAVEQQKKSVKWTEGYIPNPATWLNQGRYEDDLEFAPDEKLNENFLDDMGLGNLKEE